MKSFESWLTTVDAYCRVVIRMKEKKSKRPTTFQINQKKKQKKEAEKKLREKQEAEGLKKRRRKAVPNRKCQHATCEDEQIEREETSTDSDLEWLLKMVEKF